MNEAWRQSLLEPLATMSAARHLLVCLDYDGTLAPIAPRPEEAKLLPGVSALLNNLASLPGTRVAIVSGRSRANLSAHSGFQAPLQLVGSHGAELPGQDDSHASNNAHAKLDQLETDLAPICQSAPGAWLERKPFGLSVHVRQASALDATRVIAQVHEVIAKWPAVQTMAGKCILELSLLRTHKGNAIEWLRADWGTHPHVLYMGDDVTDEAAFASLSPSDLGIKIGTGDTSAAYRVPSEHEALAVLTWMFQARRSHLT